MAAALPAGASGDPVGVAVALGGYSRPLAAAGDTPTPPVAGRDVEGIFGKPLPCRRCARHAWVFSPSSGPASPRAAASTRSVSVSGVLAATSVFLPQTATHTLSRGSNRMPHRGNLARSFRVSSPAWEFSSGIAPSRLLGAQSVFPAYGREVGLLMDSPDSARRPAGQPPGRRPVIAALVVPVTITHLFG